MRWTRGVECTAVIVSRYIQKSSALLGGQPDFNLVFFPETQERGNNQNAWLALTDNES
jgi:hypothetical protein